MEIENWDRQLKQQVESLENLEPGFIFRLVTGPRDGFYYNPFTFTPDKTFYNLQILFKNIFFKWQSVGHFVM